MPHRLVQNHAPEVGAAVGAVGYTAMRTEPAQQVANTVPVLQKILWRGSEVHLTVGEGLHLLLAGLTIVSACWAIARHFIKKDGD